MKRTNAKTAWAVWSCTLGVLLGCETPSTPPVTPPLAAAEVRVDETPVTHSIKAMAPVDLELKTSRDGERIVLRLVVTAQIDINQMVARFDVPENAPLRGGKGQREFGGVLQGETKELEIVLDSPPEGGGYRVGAGVDVYLTPKLKRHKGTSVIIGKIVEPESLSEVVKAPGATGGIRVERAESQ